MLQNLPDWVNENLFRWIVNNGLAVVFVVLLLALVITPLFVLTRSLTTDISSKIDNAITLFSQTLSLMSSQQEAAANQVSQAVRENTAVMAQMSQLLAGVNKSQDITLRFIAENMANLTAHREIVEPRLDPSAETPETGVLKSVSEEDSDDTGG